MLQHLINAYAEAYTVAISPNLVHANDRRVSEHQVDTAEPERRAWSGGWRALLSAFL